jgi:UDP-glucose 4-epimerase
MNYLIVGGAGFIGSHLVSDILIKEKDAFVTIYDNFSSGKVHYLDNFKQSKKFKIIKADIKEFDNLVSAAKNIDIAYHLASNPDISKAITQPDIDFWEGTYLTSNILEAMRINKVKRLIYSSGSGVYGDTGSLEVGEDYSPLLPVSTYGASKLSSEALICAYCYMFDLDAVAFRFANVVGPRQTHGVGFDFVKKAMNNPNALSILGDGNQSKSYLYITDALSAMRLLEKNTPQRFSYYNVATLDYLTVNEIAGILTEVMGLPNLKYEYAGGKTGWKGDVSVIRLNSEKIRKLGWKNRYTSKEAMYLAIRSLYSEAKEKI